MVSPKKLCLQCRWSLLIFNLLKLQTMNINRSNKRKWFHIKKGKQTISYIIMKNADYTHDLALLTNTPAQAASLLFSLE